MRTIAISNAKGGSCKTTTAVNLAAALASLKKRVLVIDLDQQLSATLWLGSSDNRALFDALLDGSDLGELPRASNTDGVDLISGSKLMAGFEKAASREIGAETLLKRSLDTLPNRWDFVLLDCPPSLGLIVVGALVAADEVLIPVESKAMALQGLADHAQTVELIRSRLNPRLHISALLACRYDVRTKLSKDVVEAMRQKFGEFVLNTVIRENVRLAEAPSHQKSIIAYDKTSPGAKDYLDAAREIAAREEKQ